jgi:hypothetical protein
MEFILPFIIIGVWLVLNHQRRHQFMKDYLDLQKKALEKGEKVSFIELFQFEHSRSQNSLRIAIIAIVLGVTLYLISFINFPDTNDPVDLIFLITGIIIGAFGIGVLVTWWIIDKPKADRIKESFTKKE